MSNEYLINYENKINLFIKIITEPFLYFIIWLFLIVLSIIFLVKQKYKLSILFILNIFLLLILNKIINYFISNFIVN